MKHLIISLATVTFVLSACSSGPSENDVQTAITQSQLAQPESTNTAELAEPVEPTLRPTSTPKPTDTLAPTNTSTNIPTPECMVECDIGTENYSIVITCESGNITTEYKNESTEFFSGESDNKKGLRLNLNRIRTYENTQNAYTIIGFIEVDEIQDKVIYDIEVKGGVFGNAPQSCKS
jgi:hypothetical protein